MAKVFKTSTVSKYTSVFKYFNKILKYHNINFETTDYNKITGKYDFYNHFVIIIFFGKLSLFLSY